MGKRLQRIGLTLIALSALFLLAQFGLKWGIDYYLRERARIPVRIGHLLINPATSRVTLSFQGVKPGQELRLDFGAVRVDWWTVFLKRLRLGNVSVDGLSLDVEKKSDGQMVVGGIALAIQSPAVSSTPVPVAEKPGKSWGVGIGQIDIHDVHVHYRDPQLDAELVIHRFHMDPAESWLAIRPTPFDADLELNGARFLLSGTFRPFLKTPDISIQLQMTDFPLKILGPFIHDAGLDGKMSGIFVMDAFELLPSTGAAAFRLRRFELNNGKLALIDHSVRPAFRWTIAPLAIKVSDIDTSDPAAVVPYSVSARLGRYEKVDLSGRWTPFGSVPDGNVNLKIDGLNLTPFSPYTQNKIGYRLATGLFDLKTKAIIKRGKLEVTNGFVAHKLHFEKLSTDELDESSKQIGLPLNLCLALLRDADDNIRLEVPLSGDLSDPKVPVGKLVWQLLGKALLAAMRAAATAFFPSDGKMGFDPVPFAPGQAVLLPEANAYLNKVGEKMAQRPEVGLKLSGLASASDWYALKKKKPPVTPEPFDWQKMKSEDKDKLLSLAAQRAEAMRAYLAETSHIDPKRLPDTAPQIDPQPSGFPRAELSL